MANDAPLEIPIEGDSADLEKDLERLTKLIEEFAKKAEAAFRGATKAAKDFSMETQRAVRDTAKATEDATASMGRLQQKVQQSGSAAGGSGGGLMLVKKQLDDINRTALTLQRGGGLQIIPPGSIPQQVRRLRVLREEVQATAKEMTLLQRAAEVAMGIGVAAAAKKASTSAMEYEQAIAGVAAVGDFKVGSEQYNQLDAMARGGSKQFGSTEKANALRELTAAGLTAEEAMKSLNDTLRLALAGEMGAARAAEIMVASMSAFGFSAEDTTRIVDTMATAANASLASINDMGEAMKFIGPVAKALDISLEETSAALAILANNGVMSGIAGRGLGSVLARMIAPAKEVRDLMGEMGVDVASLNPRLVGLESAFTSLARLDQTALVRLFGAENLDISNILAANAGKFGAMTKRMQEGSGAAQRFADTLANTTTGAMNKAKNSLDEVTNSWGRLLNTAAKPVAGGLATFFDNAATGMDAAMRSFTAGDLPDINAHLGRARAGIMEAETPEEYQKAVDKASASLANMAAALKQVSDDTSWFASDTAKENVAAFGKKLREFSGLVTSAPEIFSEQEVKRARELAELMERQKTAGVLDKWGADLSRTFTRMADPFLDHWQGPPMPTGLGDEDDQRRYARIGKAEEARQKAAKKLAAEEAKVNAERSEYMRGLEVTEAQAAGRDKEAAILQAELTYLREKRRLMEELNYSAEEAAALAQRAAIAEGTGAAGRGTSLPGTVADSLQSVGGGGGIFGFNMGSIAQEQLAVQREMVTRLTAIETQLSKGGLIITTSY